MESLPRGKSLRRRKSGSGGSGGGQGVWEVEEYESGGRKPVEGVSY